LRFVYLSADFPNYSPWMIDQAKFTDEGWWASAAVLHHVLGQWNLPGDYNPAAAVPVWPFLLVILFHFTGVSAIAARALSVLCSLGTLGIVFLLVRRYASDIAAALAILLLAASPFAYAFSRLAILDTVVVFEFCLLMLIASYASNGAYPLAVLSLLIPGLVLTKTTAVLLLPAVFWLAWTAMKTGIKFRILSAALVASVSGVLLKAYAALVASRGFAADYHYFFAVNAVDDMAWDHALGTMAGVLKNCMWIDPILYPLSGLVLIVATLWLRGLWRNPLFAACWIAFVCQAIFIFTRQEDYAPRYFLAMLVPLTLVVVLTIDEAKPWGQRAFLLAPFAIALVLNGVQTGLFLHRRTYQFYDAAQSIAAIVNADPGGNRLLLGVSGSQISLMTGLPAISDVYGTQDLGEKMRVYRPGWFLAWNGIGPGIPPAFLGFRLERIATYPVFDDDERNRLVLYRMVQRAP
jgi:4-amino-4-deoxy-L-arabinose transferase-like glycosyltransferase